MADSTYSAVLKAVRAHLGDVSAEAVRQRRERLQKLVTMPNDIALYVLAHRIGMKVHQLVKDPETLDKVASYVTQVSEAERAAAGGPERTPTKRAAPPTKRAPAAPPTAADLVNINVPPGLLSPKHVREAERMSKRVYPLLYVFENSIREYVDGHLTAVHGPEWFENADSTLVSGDVRKAVDRARRADDEERWHSARNARPIYYTELGNLAAIVTSQEGWKVFGPPRFPRQSWFTELIHSAQVSRNIVAHMNPLQPADVTELERSVRKWFKQIKGDEPPAVT
jgi:hypothetical protein